MAEDDVRAMFRRTGLAAHTDNNITNIETLLLQLDLIRLRGFAVDDEEDVKGVACIGAPFFNHAGACAGALSVTGLKADLPEPRIEGLAAAIRAQPTRYPSWSAAAGTPALRSPIATATAAEPPDPPQTMTACSGLMRLGGGFRPNSARAALPRRTRIRDH